MSNIYETLEGELYWVRTREPEVFNNKAQWKCMIRPNQESLAKVMDLLTRGVKNQLKKDDKGYYINFSRPTERKNKQGKVLQVFEAPAVFKEDGVTPLVDDLIGNGSKGIVTLELYQHATPSGGKAYAARLYSITVTELVKYEGGNKPVNQPEGWGN